MTRKVRLLGDMHSPEGGIPLKRGTVLELDEARADRMVERGVMEYADGRNQRGVALEPGVTTLDPAPPIVDSLAELTGSRRAGRARAR